MKRATIIVPTDADNADSAIDSIRKVFAERHGGATVVRDADGDWVDKNGDVVSEPVALVFTVADQIPDDVVERTARNVKKITNEDAVLWIVDDVDAGFA